MEVLGDSLKYLSTQWLSQLHNVISLFIFPCNPCFLFSLQSAPSLCSSDSQQDSPLSSKVFEILVLIMLHLGITLPLSNSLHKTFGRLSGAFGWLFEIYGLGVLYRWNLYEKNNKVKYHSNIQPQLY